MTVLEVLTKARALITDPIHWTTGTFARDKNGNYVYPISKAAFNFCASGAITRVCDNNLRDELAALNKLEEFGDIIRVNDFEGHTAVLAYFDKTIASINQ